MQPFELHKRSSVVPGMGRFTMLDCASQLVQDALYPRKAKQHHVTPPSSVPSTTLVLLLTYSMSGVAAAARSLAMKTTGICADHLVDKVAQERLRDSIM